MFYWLLYEKLFPYFHPLRIFRYLTFRTAFASLTALLITLFIGPWVIQKLREFQIGQFIREDGPQSHLKKSGTPTMGGVLILIAILLPTVLWSDPVEPVCLDHGLFDPGLRSYRFCRRLHQGGAAAQPGPDGARQAAVARAGRSADSRCAGGDGSVQAIQHATFRAFHQKPAPGPLMARMAQHSSASRLAGFSALCYLGCVVAGGHVERGESDGRARRFGDRLYNHRCRRLGRAHLCQRPRGLCRLS